MCHPRSTWRTPLRGLPPRRPRLRPCTARVSLGWRGHGPARHLGTRAGMRSKWHGKEVGGARACAASAWRPRRAARRGPRAPCSHACHTRRGGRPWMIRIRWGRTFCNVWQPSSRPKARRPLPICPGSRQVRRGKCSRASVSGRSASPRHSLFTRGSWLTRRRSGRGMTMRRNRYLRSRARRRPTRRGK